MWEAGFCALYTCPSPLTVGLIGRGIGRTDHTECMTHLGMPRAACFMHPGFQVPWVLVLGVLVLRVLMPWVLVPWVLVP